MSFFNLRRGGSAAKSPAPTAPAESVETVRKHARQRLIGAAVLVLLGVIGFPLIFDTQPRPVAVDIPIEIPSRTASKTLPPPPSGSVTSAAPAVDPAVAAAAAAPSTPAGAAAPVLAPAAPVSSVVPPATSLQAKEEIVPPAAKPAAAEAKPAAKVEPKPAPKVEAKPEVKAPAKAEPKVDAKAAEAQRAKALLEGQVPAATAVTAATNEDRLVVQVGAFADANKAREARLKLEKAGLKTYTQVAETKDGKRIRVRVGPYASKAEAEKAAAKIKTLDLPASVLAL